MAEREHHTVTARGPFTTEDLRRIISLLSDIEAQRPTETFEVYVDAPSMEGEAEKILEEINPLRPGYERIVRYRPR